MTIKDKQPKFIREFTEGQLEYLQELVMFAYEMEVPEQKGWDVQTYDNLVDEVMKWLIPIISGGGLWINPPTG